MKITTWNINGIRASNREEPLKKILDSLEADVICLQETKVTRELLEASVAIVDGYHAFFSFSRVKGGYSGVATYCKASATPHAAEEGLSGTLISPVDATSVGNYGNIIDLSTEDITSLDSEGRAIITEHLNKDGWKIAIINVYCPRADRDNEERLTYKLNFYRVLQARCEALMTAGRHVIVVGDFNISHRKIDHCDPDCDPEYFRTNKSRQWISNLLYPISDFNCEVISSQDKHKVSDEYLCKTEGSLEKYVPDTIDEIEHGQNDSDNEYNSGQAGRIQATEQNMSALFSQENMLSPVFHNSATAGLRFVDMFRYFHPNQTEAFTCWSTMTGARKTNYGTRIDYVIACQDFAREGFLECSIRPDIMGSDHCPVEAVLKSPFEPASTLPQLCASLLPEFVGKQQSIKNYFGKKGKETEGRRMNGLSEDKKRKASTELERTDNGGKLNKVSRGSKDSKGLLNFFSKSEAKKKDKIAKVASSNLTDDNSRFTALSSSCDTSPKLKFSLSDPSGLKSRAGPFCSTQIDEVTEEPRAHKPDNDVPPLLNGSKSDSKVIGSGVSGDKATSAFGNLTRTNNGPKSKSKTNSDWKTILRGPEPPPLCYGHKEPSVLRTVKKEGPNLGKQFYCCARPQGHATDKQARCSFFVWKKK